MEPLKNHWVCVCWGWPMYQTIAETKKSSIQKLIECSAKDWKWWQKNEGVRCIKVHMIFLEVIK